MEIRLKTLDIECRDDGSYKIGGYVNVTERESELLYSGKRGKWFNEVVKQGAFTRSLKNGKEIPLLLEHDYEKRLADTNTNLTLKEDQIGLRFDAEIRDKDVYEKVKNKQINNCSFGFLPVEQEFEPVSDVREKRYLKDLELLEISLVENPAYAGSLVEVRNLNEKEEEIRKNKEDDNSNKDKDAKEVKDTKEKDENKDKKSEVKDEKSNTKDEKSEVKDEKESKTEDNTKKSEKTKETDVKEDKKSEKDGKKSKNDEESRGFVEEQIEKIESDVKNESNTAEVINEIIEEKEQQLQNAEVMESWTKEELDYVKESNKEHENFLENDLARRNLEVLKLRVQLLKLKSI